VPPTDQFNICASSAKHHKCLEIAVHTFNVSCGFKNNEVINETTILCIMGGMA